MSRPVALVGRFLGVAGLGLLSASAFTLSFNTLPALLQLPDPSLALPVYWRLRQHTAAAQSIVSLGTATLLGLSFGLSPRYARHPYLLWMALTVGLGHFALPPMFKIRSLEVSQQDLEEGRGRSGQEMRINGEAVRDALDGWTKMLRWQAVVWATGWAMGTVGLWGDGY